MKRLFIFAVIGILVGLFLALQKTEQPSCHPVASDSQWGIFRYEVKPDEYDGNFDLAATITTPTELTSGLRLLCHFVDDENYTAITLTPSGAEVISVQAGRLSRKNSMIR